MATEIVVTEVFENWYNGLDDTDFEAVNRVVDLLEIQGTSLGYPHSSSIRGSKYPLRELRTQSRGRPLRIFYIFDPQRQAVLLLGGDKTGDSRFYETHIPQCERLFEQHLAEIME